MIQSKLIAIAGIVLMLIGYLSMVLLDFFPEGSFPEIINEH